VEDVKQFSIGDIKDVYTQESDEFFYAKILALSTYPNSHKALITPEVLRKYGTTIKGKWIVADIRNGDATTHTPSEKIVGIVPADSEPEFIEHEDGNVSMYVDAVLSKIYATDVWKMFKSDNYRNVSVEFLSRDGEELPSGEIPVLEMDIKGLTILGRFIAGSCPNAGMEVYQFSEDKAIKYFAEIEHEKDNNLKSFAEKRMKQLKEEEKNLVSHPMNKSKEALDTGAWDGDKARHDLIKEKNYATLAKSVCLELKEGWEDRKVTALGYPVMNLKGGEWVYNKQGLTAAKAAASGAHGAPEKTAIVSKVEGIEKKLGLYKEEKEMAEKEEDIVMEEEAKKPEENKAKEEEKEMGCHMEEEKKFSLDAYVDSGAMLALLEAETETYKGLADKVMKEMSAEDIVMEFVKVVKERDELKAEKDKEEKDKTEKKFMSIMAEYKEGLSTDNFVKLYEEGKILKFEELDGFVNKIKSFAKEVEKKEDDRIFKFAGTDNSIKEHVDEDVFDRIKKK